MVQLPLLTATPTHPTSQLHTSSNLRVLALRTAFDGMSKAAISWATPVPFFLLLCYLFFGIIDATAIIPQANGTYGVGLSIAKLTDEERVDPYNPKQHRSVIISAFYPVAAFAECKLNVVEYMPPKTAQVQDDFYAQYGIPSGMFESLHLSVCKTSLQTHSYPLLLFSPGLGNSRLIYSALAQSIATHGYIVITIDHPYDANVVEFPDGTLVFGANITTDAQIEQALDVRVKDVSFILDKLSHPSAVQQIIPSSCGDLDTAHVLVAGHSLGGATAAQSALEDSRLIGGVNLDGTFFGSVVTHGLVKPFLIFGHEGKNQSTDVSWKVLWPRLRAWKRELELKGSQHATFSDLPVLVDVLGLRVKLPGVDELLGTIKGERARLVVSTFVAAFAGFVRGTGGEQLFEGSMKLYPEVSIVAK